MKDRQEKKLVAINIRNVPRGLRKRFKTHCAKHERTMNDVLVELIRQVVLENVKLKI